MLFNSNEFRAELERLGEQSVRQKLGRGEFNKPETRLAREWLRQKNPTPAPATTPQSAPAVRVPLAGRPVEVASTAASGANDRSEPRHWTWVGRLAALVGVIGGVAVIVGGVMRLGQTQFGYEILGRDPPRTQIPQSSTLSADLADSSSTSDAPASESTSAPSAAELPPPTVRAAGEQTEEAQRLAQQVAILQRDLELARGQLADVTRSSLDPQSELGALVRQLGADNRDARQNAATGLFVIRDTRSAQALMDYYWRDPREAVGINGYYSYMQFVWDLDKQLASDFAVKMLASDVPDSTSEAFRFIGNIGDRETRDFDVWFTSKLEDVALRHADALSRTRAKALIERRTQLRQRMDDDGRRFEEDRE